MDGFAEAAYEELKFRYYDQAVAQGMRPGAALALAERAAAGALGPLRPVGSSADIWGQSTPAAREAAPRVSVADDSGSFTTRRLGTRAAPAPAPARAPAQAAPRRAAVSGGGGTVRPYVRGNTPAEAAALMETAGQDYSRGYYLDQSPQPVARGGGGTVRPYVRRNTPEEVAALMETAATPRAMVTSGGGAIRPYVRRNTPEEAAALMETAAKSVPVQGVPVYDDRAYFPPEPRAQGGGGTIRPYVRRNSTEEAAALMESAMLQDEPAVTFGRATGPGAEALVEVPVSFAQAAEEILMGPQPVSFASGAEGITFTPEAPVRFGPADVEMGPDPAAFGHSTRSGPLDVRPNTEAELRGLMEARAVEAAAERAFNAPTAAEPPRRDLQRASFADSLLRALGLR